VVLLTSVALVAGFLLLFAAAVVPGLVRVFAWATSLNPFTSKRGRIIPTEAGPRPGLSTPTRPGSR
jgi:hypothetical protein